MAKFATLVIAILFFGLFAAALITGGIKLAQSNDVDHSIADDASVSAYARDLNQSLISSASDGADALNATSTSPVTATAFGTSIDAISRLWKTIIGVPKTVYNLTLGLVFQKLFGDESYVIVTSVLAAILVIIIIVTVYKMATSGDGI